MFLQTVRINLYQGYTQPILKSDESDDEEEEDKREELMYGLLIVSFKFMIITNVNICCKNSSKAKVKDRSVIKHAMNVLFQQ